MPSLFQRERNLVIIILLLAAINGLLYVFIVPPWQHYDEPNHFEYIWLLVERDERPKMGDYDTAMRKAVATSMIEHGFFDGTTIPLPDLAAEKPWIGNHSQLDDPPLYYLLASLPQHLLPRDDVTTQLYAARIVSLALFLVTILAGWGLIAEITPPRHPLRFLVPLTMALLPAYVDLMTSVNNDVGAIASFSLFLWGCIRLIRRGPSLWNLLWVLATVGLCLFAKRTVYLALPLFGIAVLFAFLRGKYRKIAWGLLVISGIGILVAAFTWGDAALWYRDTSQSMPTRAETPDAPDGETVFRLAIQPGEPPVKLVQVLPVDAAHEMSGKTHTLGAWIWASYPIEINSPQLVLYDGNQVFGGQLRIDETPRFYAFSFMPDGNTDRAWVLLRPGKNLPGDSPSIEIYYDGVVLAEGSYPLDMPPSYSQGIWGNAPFENLLRNGSAESSWVYLHPWAETLGNEIFSDRERASLTVYTLIDWPSTGWYYRYALEGLFRNFWAKFAWGHVGLLGAKPYRLLLYFTFVGFLGLVWALWQKRNHLAKLPWDALFLLVFASVLIWSLTLLRGANYIFTPVYWPVARYAYPVIIPTVFLLCLGWYTLLCSLERWLRLPRWSKFLVYVGFLLVLNVYSLASIIAYYA